MPGYSGTPLPKKLGIKPGFRVATPNIPAEVQKEIAFALRDCRAVRSGSEPLDFVLAFVTTEVQLHESFSQLSGSLAPAGMLWVAWPKKSSGVKTDLDENKVRAIGLKAGVVDVKVCAITEIWSGLKFVIRIKDRARMLKSEKAPQSR